MARGKGDSGEGRQGREGARARVRGHDNNNDTSAPLALLFLPLPPTTAHSLLHPTLNLSVSILVLLSSS